MCAINTTIMPWLTAQQPNLLCQWERETSVGAFLACFDFVCVRKKVLFATFQIAPAAQVVRQIQLPCHSTLHCDASCYVMLVRQDLRFSPCCDSFFFVCGVCLSIQHMSDVRPPSTGNLHHLDQDSEDAAAMGKDKVEPHRHSTRQHQSSHWPALTLTVNTMRCTQNHRVREFCFCRLKNNSTYSSR